MKYMHKAVWQADGNLMIRGDTRALLFRAVELAQAQAARQGAGSDPQAARAFAALSQALGAYDGKLPELGELLGDPRQEMIARNLMIG